MLSNRRLKNFLIVIFLTLTLVVSTTFLSSEVQNQPLYQVIKAAIESETGISTDSILKPTATSAPDSASSKDSSTAPSSKTATQSGEFAVITKVIDGDTVELETGEKLRYIGINTPETQHPQKGKECFGAEATEANKKLVEGKAVRLEKDVSEVDRYGRLLRYVWLEDTLINESLVLEGFAYASTYPPDIKYQDTFTIAEQQARENKKGFWSACPLPKP